MITVKDLSQLRFLKHEITVERERLVELCIYCGYGKKVGGEAVSGGSTQDRTAYYACEIAYLKELIAQNMRRAVNELLRMERFISDIEDSEMRTIFIERYIRGKSWLVIAFMLGSTDEQIPRKRHDRFLKKYNERFVFRNEKSIS